MTPDEYQKLASRTRCPQHGTLIRMSSGHFYQAQRHKFPDHTGVHPPENSGAMLLHGVIGLTGEVGELATAVEHYAYYKKEFDRSNVIEELGDALWYIAELCDALDVSMEQVMSLNIMKLRKRFPEKFDHDLAKEENRDREGEAKAMEDPACSQTKKVHKLLDDSRNWTFLATKVDDQIHSGRPLLKVHQERVEEFKKACVVLGLKYTDCDDWYSVAARIQSKLDKLRKHQDDGVTYHED